MTFNGLLFRLTSSYVRAGSHGSQVLHPNYDMDAYMNFFLDVNLGTYVGSRVEQKARPNSQPKYNTYLCIKISKYNFNDNEPYFSDYLRLTSWDSASHVEHEWGLGLGTLCELAPTTGCFSQFIGFWPFYKLICVALYK